MTNLLRHNLSLCLPKTCRAMLPFGKLPARMQTNLIFVVFLSLLRANTVTSSITRQNTFNVSPLPLGYI
jgi:hypothetical protein